MSFGRGSLAGHRVTLRRFDRTFTVGHGRTWLRCPEGASPSPSINLIALSAMCLGCAMAHSVGVLGSLDIIRGEVDR